MNINKFLTAAVLRLLNDTPENNNNNEETLEELMDDFRIIKGPRKPDNTDECITVHVLTAPQDPDTKQIDGTLQINYYYKNHENGNANIEQLGPVADRIHELFDDKPFDDIDGYRNYNLVGDEPIGPLWDRDEPEEHYMSVRFSYGLLKGQ